MIDPICFQITILQFLLAMFVVRDALSVFFFSFFSFFFSISITLILVISEYHCRARVSARNSDVNGSGRWARKGDTTEITDIKTLVFENKLMKQTGYHLLISGLEKLTDVLAMYTIALGSLLTTDMK